MSSLLLQQGHTVVEAQAAREAIALHRAEPFDLIVTDLVMKEMDGTELLRRIRAFAPETPVIAVSGARQGRIYLGMARLLGAHRVLAKPFSDQEFLQAVAAALPPAVSDAGANDASG